MKTYGDLSIGSDARGRRCWGMRLQPDAAIRAKRIFPRVEQSRTGIITLSDTIENALELEWFVQRFPLAATDTTLAHLARRAEEFRDRAQAIEDVYAGMRTDPDWPQKPARPPREYQLQAAAMMRVSKRLLLADDVGLGKTFSSLLLLLDPEALPALVVTLTHLPNQWLRELERSVPWLTGHAIKTGKFYETDAHVLVSNYHKLGGWADHLSGNIRTVIFDEIQELRHSGTVKYRAASMIADKAEYVVGLSATPIHNYGGEMHTVMDVIQEGSLGTRQEFLREWGAGNSGAKDIIENPAALGTHLRDLGLLLRRTRTDVHRELPLPILIEQEVENDSEIIDAAHDDVAAMAALLLDKDSSRDERFHAAGEIDWRLRHATGVSKAKFVAKFVRLLLESEDKVVLFGWHRDVYSIWLAELAEFFPIMYTGSESPRQKDMGVQEFLTNQDSRVFICSLRSGAGLDGLQDAASVAVFGELDWSPQIHKQAIGRLARDGQEATVAAYFLVSNEGSDPVIADVLDIKRMQSDPMMDPGAEVFAPTGADTSDRIRRLASAVLAKRVDAAAELFERQEDDGDAAGD